MVVSYSPHRSAAGGTLHFPSPTHVHHPDTSVIRSLRRSLSRSPSKGPQYRLVTSNSPSPTSPLSPSPRSASPKPSSPGVSCTITHTQSPLAIPFPPSVKVNRTANRRLTPMRSTAMTRSKTTPGSPIKFPLQLSKNSANRSPPSPKLSVAGDENRGACNISPAEKHKLENHSRALGGPDDQNTQYFSVSGLEKSSAAGLNVFAATSSPLKRSDGIMNLDQASLGSPVAKRRSLHGASFGPDFNIFDHAPPQFDSRNDSADDPDMSGSSASLMAQHFTPPFASMPKRSSSLRKSTLQQRHGDKPNFVRSRPGASDLGFEFVTPGPAASKSRTRVSLDNFLPPMPRDSPFSAQGSLPNASMHLVSQQPQISQNGSHQPHPLSRTMTTSSSGSSLADLLDESPTHAPIHPPIHPRPTIDFSKSLPVGSSRPLFKEPAARELAQKSSTESSFATPQNYKLVKPLPAAFMSTGLISKRNRNPEERLMGGTGSKAQMPDTPCKRPTTIFTAGFSTVKNPDNAAPAKQVRHEFGTPSTPFNPHSIRPPPGTFGKGVSVFGSGFGKGGMSRRGSFVSVDGDENSESPSSKGRARGHSLSGSDFDFPPTPTKQPFSSANSQNGSAESSRGGIFGQRSVDDGSGSATVSAMGRNSWQNGQSSSPLFEQLSPRTPQEHIVPPDPSGLSISGHASRHINPQVTDSSSSAAMLPPATPTAGRECFPQFGGRRPSITPINGFAPVDLDGSLTSRFNKVELIGTGEFSQVYRVTQPQNKTPDQELSPGTPLPDRVFAVKKSRNPYAGMRDRERKLQEVAILKALGQSDHIVQLIDSWEDKNHLYMQTEFCEEGSLDLFLSQIGRKARLDDFRIWKILLELSLGVKHIHDSGYIHLDLKPANILITFEGVLKIADFGMATQWPAPAGIEGEGDREYIGPEILMGKFDKPADIFALGLIMLEIAGNVELPDNGPSWQKLRTGDMSDVPSLTWSSASSVPRDASGNPLSTEETCVDFYDSDSGDDDLGSPTFLRRHKKEKKPRHSSTFGSDRSRRGELLQAPSFMVDAQNDEALDKIVRWMISPRPEDRPVAGQILDTVGVKWAETRRRAGATVFEGNWGPADDIVEVDSEMIDV